MVVADAPADFSQGLSGSRIQQAAFYEPVPDESLDRYDLVKGSGGIPAPRFRDYASGALVVFTLMYSSPDTSLHNIRAAFDLNNDELAKATKTTRKTIYNWFDGTSAPRKSNLDRIFDLHVVAKDWIDAGFSADRALLKRKILDQKSVFDLLCEDKVDRDRILFAGSRLSLIRPSQRISDPFA